MKNTTSKQYKDTFIRRLLSEKHRAIEVANALLDENFDENIAVSFHNLTDSLLERYNDIAFNIGNTCLIIIEHQSTINPNMAIRLLGYFSNLLFTYYVQMEKLYSQKLFKIPTPVFYVLYNGKEKLKIDVLRLSDSFYFDHEFSIEVTVKIIDINRETNHPILTKSESLQGYAYLIAAIRKFLSQGETRDEAVKKAIDECIQLNILADFLQDNFKEAINMLSLEYDREAEFEVLRREYREEGREKGRQEGRQEGREEGIGLGIQQGREEAIKASVLKMYQKGHDVHFISDILDKSVDWVQQVLREC